MDAAMRRKIRMLRREVPSVARHAGLFCGFVSAGGFEFFCTEKLEKVAHQFFSLFVRYSVRERIGERNCKMNVHHEVQGVIR